MAIDASAAATAWKTSMQTAATKYTAGVNKVTQSPMQAAAANAAGYIQGVTDAVNNGKYVKGLNRVSLSDWKTAATQKGAQRLASGATAAADKVSKFWASFGPKLDAVTTQVNAMPSATFEDRMAKANAQMTGVHALKGNAY
jgi:hypothetical protein